MFDKSAPVFAKQSQFLQESKCAQALFSQRIMKMNAARQPGESKAKQSQLPAFCLEACFFDRI
jgi:hypothetical protein